MTSVHHLGALVDVMPNKSVETGAIAASDTQARCVASRCADLGSAVS